MKIERQKCNSFLWSETHFCKKWSNPISKTLPGVAFYVFEKRLREFRIFHQSIFNILFIIIVWLFSHNKLHWFSKVISYREKKSNFCSKRCY